MFCPINLFPSISGIPCDMLQFLSVLVVGHELEESRERLRSHSNSAEIDRPCRRDLNESRG